MKNIVIDFETYYDSEVSVTTLGVENYVNRAEAYLVSAVSQDFEFCGSIADLPKALGDAWIGDRDLQFWAANSNFDSRWWRKYYPLTAHPWKCILDRGAFHQLPRELAGLAKTALNVRLDKQVRDDMKGVQFESLPEDKQQRVLDYCLMDSLTTKKLVDLIPAPNDAEEALAEQTRGLNRKGIHVNAERVRRDCNLLDILRHKARHSLPWVEEGGAPLSFPEFCAWCKKQGVLPPSSIDKRDAECNAWIKTNPTQAQVLKSMRLVRGCNTKIEKLKLISSNVDESGRIGLDLIYCGARHTRRWSSKNINVQNLDKETVFVEELTALCGSLSQEDTQEYGYDAEDCGINMRAYFLPPPGCKFAIIDYSQIEPRCLNWLVRNEEMLGAMRAGYGIYEAHAKATMKWTGAPGTLKHTDPRLYKFAKERVLSLGYGMGKDAFKDRAALVGINLTIEEAAIQVADYRRSNSKIVSMWKDFDGLIRSAAKEHTPLIMQMPTGDSLMHFNVKAKKGGRAGGGYESLTIRGERSNQSRQPRLWGGTLTENVTQRMARDVMADGLLRLDREGFNIVFHAHDEIILAVDVSSAESDLQEAQRLLSIPPEWANDLPLAVAGGLFEHYVKMD